MNELRCEGKPDVGKANYRRLLDTDGWRLIDIAGYWWLASAAHRAQSECGAGV